MSTKNTNSQLVSKIFKSRKIILDLAKKRGFETEEYNNFTINDILVLKENKQLDMLLEHKDTDKRIYYKYHLHTKVRPNQMQDYIEDLFQLDDPPILKKDDDLIVVCKESPNTTLINLLKLEYEQSKYYVNIYNLHNYLYNLLENNLVPMHDILSNDDKKKIAERYNITVESNWPEISRFDPVALAIGLRPGEVTEITRNSPTALETKYYRLCK